MAKTKNEVVPQLQHLIMCWIKDYKPQFPDSDGANLPELQGRGRSMRAQNGSGHYPDKTKS